MLNFIFHVFQSRHLINVMLLKHYHFITIHAIYLRDDIPGTSQNSVDKMRFVNCEKLAKNQNLNGKSVNDKKVSQKFCKNVTSYLKLKKNDLELNFRYFDFFYCQKPFKGGTFSFR